MKNYKKTSQLIVGSVAVFEDGGKIFKGVVSSKIDGQESYVQPDANGNTRRNYQISDSSSPHMLRDLIIEEKDYVNGMTVLVTWQELEDGHGFVELVPAQIVEANNTLSN